MGKMNHVFNANGLLRALSSVRVSFGFFSVRVVSDGINEVLQTRDQRDFYQS